MKPAMRRGKVAVAGAEQGASMDFKIIRNSFGHLNTCCLMDSAVERFLLGGGRMSQRFQRHSHCTVSLLLACGPRREASASCSSVLVAMSASHP